MKAASLLKVGERLPVGRCDADSPWCQPAMLALLLPRPRHALACGGCAVGASGHEQRRQGALKGKRQGFRAGIVQAAGARRFERSQLQYLRMKLPIGRLHR